MINKPKGYKRVVKHTKGNNKLTIHLSPEILLEDEIRTMRETNKELQKQQEQLLIQMNELQTQMNNAIQIKDTIIAEKTRENEMLENRVTLLQISNKKNEKPNSISNLNPIPIKNNHSILDYLNL